MTHPREALHLEARACMRAGDFTGAVGRCREALNQYGPHVRLLVDLASCYYMLDDYPRCRQYTLQAQEALDANFDRLSEATCFNGILGLGKLLEEMGRLAEALRLYKKGLELSALEPHSSLNQDKIRVQHLRLLCLAGIHEELPLHYSICEQIATSDGDFEIDLQNTLMIVDYQLFGPEIAWQRIHDRVRDERLAPADRRLLLFNFLMEALKRPSAKLPEDFFSGVSYFECGAYDKGLWDIHLFDLNETPLQELTLNRIEIMSPLSGLIYLHLLQLREETFPLAHEARRKAQFLLRSLDTASRNLILKTWDFRRPSSVRTTLRMSSGAIAVGDRELRLNKSQTFRRLLDLLAERSVWPTETLIARLYATEADLTAYDRLRVLVSRINRRVELELGITPLLKLEKQHLSISEFIDLIPSHSGSEAC